MKKYIVTEDADRLAPAWLAVRINYITNKFLYRTIDGAIHLIGVRVGEHIAHIGDTICYDRGRLRIEKKEDA